MALNIISYSLWGDSPKYWNGAFRNIEVNNKMLPNFISRFYIDSKCSFSNIESIKKYENIEVILVDSDNSWHGMFWRFYGACDSNVDVFLSRDTDSRIENREVSAINQWLDSDKNFHIMRDHPYHLVPILGGMWGCRNKILNNIDFLIDNWKNHTHRKGNWRDTQVAGDQNFLAEVVYPIVVNDSMEHSEFNIRFGGEIRTFPTIRNNYEFVGDVFDENDERHPEYWKIIKKLVQ